MRAPVTGPPADSGTSRRQRALTAASRLVYYASMPRAHRYTTVDQELVPTWTTRSHDYHGQIQSMREIRELSNELAHAYRRRDERMQALALSGSLSRQDMARAAGLSKARVDQIIKELTEQDQRRRNAEGLERVRRHMGPELQRHFGV